MSNNHRTWHGTLAAAILSVALFGAPAPGITSLGNGDNIVQPPATVIQAPIGCAVGSVIQCPTQVQAADQEPDPDAGGNIRYSLFMEPAAANLLAGYSQPGIQRWGVSNILALTTATLPI
jgi:hypothetical protein